MVLGSWNLAEAAVMVQLVRGLCRVARDWSGRRSAREEVPAVACYSLCPWIAKDDTWQGFAVCRLYALCLKAPLKLL